MSAAAERIAPLVQDGPSLRARIAAIAVVVALGALAAYAVFGGPTTVPIGTPAKAPTRAVQPAGVQPQSEGEGSDRGG